MTQHRSELLEKAIAELSNLPLEAEILAGLADEAKWDRSFASGASQSWLAAQAQKMRALKKEGKLAPIECNPEKT
jgi:hypothetical protein